MPNNKNVPVHLAPAGAILYNKHIKTEKEHPFMKIFKNRGDIYLSKSRTGADREQHILLGILAAVLLVSVVVVVYVGAKNDFSAKKFFARTKR